MYDRQQRNNIEIFGREKVDVNFKVLKNQSESWISPGNLFMKKGTNPV